VQVVWARYTVHALLMSFVVPFLWLRPSSAQLGLFLLLGTAEAVGHFLLIRRWRFERASALSPFGHGPLLWVTLLGFLVFGQLPDRHVVIVMAIIVGSGLHVVWGDRARKNEKPETAIE